MISENNSQALMEEFELLNLKKYIPEIVKAIISSKLTAREQHSTVEICTLMHVRYEEFAEELIPQIEKHYKSIPIAEFNKKRNILRYLTELYFKGLFLEYKRIFKCLQELILINHTDEPE